MFQHVIKHLKPHLKPQNMFPVLICWIDYRVVLQNRVLTFSFKISTRCGDTGPSQRSTLYSTPIKCFTKIKKQL